MKNIYCIILLVIFYSCTTEENYEHDLSGEEQNEMEELSLIIGEILKEPLVMNEVISTINKVDEYGKSVSFSLLLRNFDKMTNFEKRKYENGGLELSKSSVFKNSLISYFDKNSKDFPVLANKIKNHSLSKSISNIDGYLIENDLELFLPYMENFENEYDRNFTITYEDGNSNSVHEGFKYNEDGTFEVYGIDDEYLFDNPTVAIIPVDNDYLGQELMISDGNGGHQYLDPNQPLEDLIEFYNDLYSLSNRDYISEAPGGGGSGNTYVPPSRVRITQNINPYTFFGENDVLTNFLPKARITTTSWKRTLSKAHRTRIARAGSTVGVNPNGNLTAVTGVFYFDFDISASDLRNDRWQTLNIMFDPNWHKAKGSQQIVVWTKRKNASTSSVNVKNEVKIDSEGNYTPTSSISLNVTAGSGSKAIFRGNSELDRDQVLTTIVNGSEYDNATINHNGLNLSVRRVSQKFEYVFDFFYTSL